MCYPLWHYSRLFKKKVTAQQVSATEVGSTPNHRNEADQSAPLGIATTRYEDRIAAAIQGAGHGSVKFDTSQAVCGAGILFLLPALLSQGLLKNQRSVSDAGQSLLRP